MRNRQQSQILDTVAFFIWSNEMLWLAPRPVKGNCEVKMINQLMTELTQGKV